MIRFARARFRELWNTTPKFVTKGVGPHQPVRSVRSWCDRPTANPQLRQSVDESTTLRREKGKASRYVNVSGSAGA